MAGRREGGRTLTSKDRLAWESELGHEVTEEVPWVHNLTDKMSFRKSAVVCQKEPWLGIIYEVELSKLS